MGPLPTFQGASGRGTAASLAGIAINDLEPSDDGCGFVGRNLS